MLSQIKYSKWSVCNIRLKGYPLHNLTFCLHLTFLLLDLPVSSINIFIAAHKGGRNCWVRVEVSMWTESHKICEFWILINQVLPWCFCSYRLWLNKSNHWAKQVGISESTYINQSILINRFYPIKELIFIRESSCFPIIHHNSIF